MAEKKKITFVVAGIVCIALPYILWFVNNLSLHFKSLQLRQADLGLGLLLAVSIPLGIILSVVQLMKATKEPTKYGGKILSGIVIAVGIALIVMYKGIYSIF